MDNPKVGGGRNVYYCLFVELDGRDIFTGERPECLYVGLYDVSYEGVSLFEEIVGGLLATNPNGIRARLADYEFVTDDLEWVLDEIDDIKDKLG